METDQETEPVTALAIVQQLTPLQLFAPGALDPIVEKIKAHVRAIETDISTDEGRKAIKSLVRKIASSKTFIDKQRETLVGDEKKRLKAIDAEGLRVWNELEALQDEVRKPLTDWEMAEEKRCNEHELMIKAITDVIGVEFSSLDKIEKARKVVDQVWDRNFQEFTKRAAQARELVLLHLDAETRRITEAAAKKAEEERLKLEREEKERVEREAKIAEDARLKAEDEAKRREEAQAKAAKQREDDLAEAAAKEKSRLEREKSEAEDRLQKSETAKRDAEQRERKAEADRIAAAKQAELDREAARKKAEDEREAAVKAERKRQEDIRKSEEEKRDAIAREQLRREADQEHRREVHGGAVLALVNQVEELTSHQARMVVQAIVKGLIKGVSITY